MNVEDYRKLAIQSFNDTWTYIDKEKLSDVDIEKMIRLAHSSKHYWVKAKGTAINMERGDWLISHVYAIVGNGIEALKFAKLCLNRVLQENIGDFDKVFAYEAMARAFQVIHNEEEMKKYLALGYKAIDDVEKESDRKYCISQLDTIK
jgi:hypothetical protein